MSSQPPPTYEFTGIDYNPQYYNTVASSGITETQANNLYLRKTIADTATAVETFSTGIKTNSIDANVAATTLNIGTNATGAINIGTSGSRTGTLTIGNSSSCNYLIILVPPVLVQIIISSTDI